MVNHERVGNPDDNADRFLRQSDLVPREQLAKLTCTVVGVGAIGRQVALQLAAMGCRTLRLIDFDTVEPTNVTTQGYRAEDVGRPKVRATAEACRAIDPSMDVEVIEDRFRLQYHDGEIVFVCVDSISARRAIWRSVGDRCRFLGDGRMRGEVVRCLCVADGEGRESYPTTLFPQAEAQRGSCTAGGTLYVASIAAGLLLHQFARWLRDQAIDPDLVLSLLGSELTVRGLHGQPPPPPRSLRDLAGAASAGADSPVGRHGRGDVLQSATMADSED